MVTDDGPLLDQVQALYDRNWSGGECAGCKLRDYCPGPLVELGAPVPAPIGKRGKPRSIERPAKKPRKSRR